MNPNEQDDRLLRASAELDTMMRLFETERDGDSRSEISGDAYEARKQRDVAELVARLEGMRRRRNRLRIFAASACGIAACIALWLVAPSDRGEAPVSAERYEVPVLIVDNRAPVALTPSADTPDEPSRDDATDLSAVTRQAGSEAPENAMSEIAESRPSRHRILVPAGQTYALQLPDGSKVVINAESSVSYTVPFADSLRELTLEGEAYFEIASSKTPFEVVAGAARIRVYGTRFNVKESAERGTVSTVLAEGSVGMRLPDGRELRMEPDQRISFDANTGDVVLQQVDSEGYMAWMQGRFKYTDTPLVEVLDDLTKWYGVKLACPDAGEVRLTLDMSRKSSLENLLADLELLSGKKIQTEKQLPMK